MVGPSNFRCVLWVHLQLEQLPLVPAAADVSQVSGNLCSGWSADLWIKISCCQALVIDIGVVVSWRITWIHYEENSCSTAPQTAEPELGHASVPQGVGLLLTSPHALVQFWLTGNLIYSCVHITHKWKNSLVRIYQGTLLILQLVKQTEQAHQGEQEFVLQCLLPKGFCRESPSLLPKKTPQLELMFKTRQCQTVHVTAWCFLLHNMSNMYKLVYKYV